MVAGDLNATLYDKSEGAQHCDLGKDRPEVNILAVRDASLNSTAPVGDRAHGSIRLTDEVIVMPASRNLGAAKTRANLEAFGSGDGEHGVSQLRLQLVEHRFAKTDGGVADDAGHSSSDRVLGLTSAEDTLYQI